MFSDTKHKVHKTKTLQNVNVTKHTQLHNVTSHNVKIEMTKKEFLPANKALVANKETLIYMTDDCNGVGMYYLKLKTLENTK